MNDNFFFQRKCDLYWPKAKEETETYGFVEVTLESEEVMANYTVRTMKIKHLKVRKNKLRSIYIVLTRFTK